MARPLDDAAAGPADPTPRRTFLALAALAPLASLTTSCATVRAAPAPAAGSASAPAPVPTPAPAPAPAAADPLEALRAVPLPESAEPAFVFRAVLPPGAGQGGP